MFSRGSKAPDKELIFFPVWAAPDIKQSRWAADIHAWVFELKQDSAWRRGALSLLAKSLGLSRDEEKNKHFISRARYFLADNLGKYDLAIKMERSIYRLAQTKKNGHSITPIDFKPESANAIGSKDTGMEFQAVSERPDLVVPAGLVQLLSARGLSVVSDIDDTIKISQVRDKKELLANTFLRSFQDVAGMARLYQGWAQQGASFHYVSASPWQLYQVLNDFFCRKGFPAGSFSLKQFRWKDRSFFNLFKPAQKTKKEAVVKLLKACPKRELVLVGDSSEKDPELYAELTSLFPRSIRRIFIRQVPGYEMSAQRRNKLFPGRSADLCQPFYQADELPAGF